jgi:hypothetical protein
MRTLSKTVIILGVVVFPSISATTWGQSTPHIVGPPVAQGLTTLKTDVDAFMKSNGYQFAPDRTSTGHTDGNRAGQDSVSLPPGNWAIGVVSISSPACPLAVSYRDAGYTVGQQVYQAEQGNGFPYILLKVQSSLSGIAINVQDADFKPSLHNGRACAYEYRFYKKSS